MDSPNWLSFRLETDEIEEVKRIQALLKKVEGLDLSLSKTARHLIKIGGTECLKRMETKLDQPS